MRMFDLKADRDLAQAAPANLILHPEFAGFAVFKELQPIV